MPCACELAYLPDQTDFAYSVAYSLTGLRNMVHTTAVEGWYNTVGGIGSFAGALTGYGNTSWGSRNAINATAAYDNTLVGYETGLNLTSGHNNSLYAPKAGYSLTVGFRNALYGTCAGFTGTGFRDNVFVGENTGFYATNSYSTLVGTEAGYKITAATSVVGVGWQALGGASVNPCVANYTIAIGYRAGWKLENGTDGVLIGRDAGINAVNASGSVIIGSMAGQAVVNNGNQVIVGSGAATLSSAASVVVVGAGAWRTATTAAQATIVGTDAGRLGTGSCVTLLGYRSGFNMTTSRNITLFGTSTGGGLIDAINSSAFGHAADPGNFSNSFALGAYAVCTKDNQFVVGNGSVVENKFTGAVVTDTVRRSIPVTKTEDFAVSATDSWIICDKDVAPCVVTLPAASTCPGREITFQNWQTQPVVSASVNIMPLGGRIAGSNILSAIVGKWCTVVSDGTIWMTVQGG